MNQQDHDKLFAAVQTLWREYCDLKADNARWELRYNDERRISTEFAFEIRLLREENELLRVEGTEESRAELDDALAQVVELRAIIEKVSSTDDVAKAYQQVYFEDERRWQDERDHRIKAESALARAMGELEILRAAAAVVAIGGQPENQK